MTSIFDKLLTRAGRGELADAACEAILNSAKTPPWDGREISRIVATDTIRFAAPNTSEGLRIYEVVTRTFSFEIPTFGRKIIFKHELQRNRVLPSGEALTRFPLAVAYCSSEPGDVLLEMAVAHLFDLVEYSASLSLRERAAIVELTADGYLEGEEVVRAAAYKHPDDACLAGAVSDPESRAEMADELHSAADSEAIAWRTRTGGTLIGAARELLRSGSSGANDGHAADSVACRRDQELNRVLSLLAQIDPLGAAIVYAEYAPSHRTLHPAIRFEEHHWKALSRAVTALWTGVTSAEKRVTMPEVRTPASPGALALLEAYATAELQEERWKSVAGVGGAAEFLATVEAVRYFLGLQADGTAAAPALLRTIEILRTRWVLASDFGRPELLEACRRAIYAVSERKTTALALWVTSREYIRNSGSVGEVLLCARAHVAQTHDPSQRVNP